jgi:hypothetical protein
MVVFFNLVIADIAAAGMVPETLEWFTEMKY